MPGTYRLRLDAVTSSPAVDGLRVRVAEGGAGFMSWLGLLLAITLLALPFAVMAGIFQASRLAGSDFNGLGTRVSGGAGATGAQEDEGDES